MLQDNTIKYRKEIDGLRAIAVLSVVFYHAQILFKGKQIAPGGFLGVDIFFVISGYLIGSILLKKLSSGEFSFINFFERRARRILPALVTVISLTVPCAWNYMSPAALIEFGGSIWSTIFFYSNFYFFLQDSYTAVASEFKPLLHTWSLSVE